MALWQITSYRTAVDIELQLRRVATLLWTRYGRRWRRRAPADLVWMLRTGINADEAYEQVRALVGVDDAASTVATDSGSYEGATLSEEPCASKVPRTYAPANHSPKVRADDLLHMNKTDGRLDEALRLNRQHWTDTGRPISAEVLRQRLRVSASTSRDLTRVVRVARHEHGTT